MLHGGRAPESLFAVIEDLSEVDVLVAIRDSPDS